MTEAKGPFLKRIGLQIRYARNDKGWSQEKLADKAHIHRTYMGRIERGETNAPIYTLKKIARVLGLKNLELE